MPTGTKLTRKQRAQIMELYKSGDLTQTDIAELLSIGGSTVSRVIAQETGRLLKPATRRSKPKHRRNISVSATYEDHAMITAYAKEHQVPIHEALHAMLHTDCTPELVNVIKREVEVMLDAAKTEVQVIKKKKWWHL